MDDPLGNPISLILLLVGLSLAPFIAMMVTSYLKIVVVLSLVRNALGIQQIPPNMVINGLALILSFYVMAPVVSQSYEIVKAQPATEDQSIAALLDSFGEAREPFRDFMMAHSRPQERAFFVRSAKELWPEDAAAGVTETDFLILVPAFTVSELTSAFQIGFLIYLPFVAIDLIVSNILLAMGMMMVSPMTISLPFKLLLFVLVDGWTRLIHGLVLTYVPG